VKRLLHGLFNVWWRLVRFGFHLLYNELAFTYDIVSKIVSLGAWHCWQRSALNHLDAAPGARILELAHGTGDLQIDLQNAGYRVFGCDLSPHMGRIARNKLRKNYLYVHLVQSRAQQLPFVSGGLAAVVATFPTNFMFEAATLREAHRVLQAGGRLVIVPNGVFTGGGLIRAFLEWLYRVTGQRSGPVDSGIMDEIANFFRQHGFEVHTVYEECPRSRAQIIIARRVPLP
jgi:ubiquinone/menaquinone biosynthesis C-methylase UbiE